MTNHDFPCTLRRQDCLVAAEFADHMKRLDAPNAVSLKHAGPAALPEPPSKGRLLDAMDSHGSSEDSPAASPGLSQLEATLSTNPPILELILLHLPTRAILDLYHTNRYLRTFLQAYPLAWRNISLRQTPNDTSATQPLILGSKTIENPGGVARSSGTDLLLRVLLPLGTRLTRLDLDNSAVSGAELYGRVLDRRRGTLQHLSVRNCKNVSVKYHLLPFLQLQLSIPSDAWDEPRLALESLYAFRCRHHRRRPYLTSTLYGKDSDSLPTHQLVDVCHRLGIWTDTAWCPTPGPRCSRRREYACNRVSFTSDAEIWVPFDRLWRSQNNIGDQKLSKSSDSASGGDSRHRQRTYNCARDVRLWEKEESGENGEPLGSGVYPHAEGKENPAHLRKSHTVFINGYRCDKCDEEIYERCESCSIRMHCIACRNTLCASCAFDVPLPASHRKVRREQPELDQSQSATSMEPPTINEGTISESHDGSELIWWAPGATRSPNKIHESRTDAETTGGEAVAVPNGQNGDASQTLFHGTMPESMLQSRWCCPEPHFVSRGTMSFQLNGRNEESVRAVPLPKGQGFEDQDFVTAAESNSIDSIFDPLGASDEDAEGYGYPPYVPKYSDSIQGSRPKRILRTRRVKPFSTDRFVHRAALDKTSSWAHKTLPRTLCKSCLESKCWRVRCAIKDCKRLLCIEHDIKTLQVRQCGLPKLDAERKAWRDAQQPISWTLTKWKNDLRSLPPTPRPADKSFGSTASEAHIKPSDVQSTNQCSPSTLPDTSANLQDEEQKDDASSNAAQTMAKGVASPTMMREDSTTEHSYLPHTPPNRYELRKRFTGCLRLFCPPPSRRQHEYQPDCPGSLYLPKCINCNVLVCYDCCGLEMGCPCSACIPNASKFRCPACAGDWETAKAVRKTTIDLVSQGKGWRAEDRGKRFWRCKLAEEEAMLKTPAERMAERRALLRELPLGDGRTFFSDDLDDIDGVFGVLEGSHTDAA